MSWTAWTLVKAESERVPGKNFRPLAGAPLLRHVLQTLHCVPELQRIVVNTDCPDRLAPLVADLPRVHLRLRPDDLRDGRLSANDLLARDVDELPDLLPGRLLMTHATNPLLRPATLRAAIAAFEAADAESLFGVTRRQARHYLDDSPVNHDPDELLPTQDLVPVDEENSCVYLFTADLVRRTGRRLGRDALRFPIAPAEAVDIDDPEDWRHAELIARGRTGPPDCVLFDLDGTLIHSMPDVALALSDALACFGIAPLDADALHPWLGYGAGHLVEGALAAHGIPTDDAEAVTEDFLVRYRARPIVHTRPFPGIEELLTSLERDGVAIGVCTNKPWVTAEPVLDALGWNDRFGVVLCPEHAPRKPDPTMLHDALRRLHAPASGAVYIGDSAADRDAAARAGLPFAWVRWGYAREPMTGEFGVDTAAELAAALPDLAHWGRLRRG